MENVRVSIIKEQEKNMKNFYDKLEKALNFLIKQIDYYLQVEDEVKEDYIDKISNTLDSITNLLDRYGYTYNSNIIISFDTESYESILRRYADNFKEYLEDTGSNTETINIDIRNLTGIIDKYNSMIKENLI